MANIMQKKLDLYEKYFTEMKQISEEEKEHIEQMTKQKDGDKEWEAVGSGVDDDYVYLEETRSFDDLHLKDQKMINEQGNLYNYTQTKTKIDKIRGWYGTARYYLSFF